MLDLNQGFLDILAWLVPGLVIVFVTPRFAEFGAWVARKLLHIGAASWTP